MQISDCSFETEGEQILAILNDAIVNSTALYDYEPRTLDNMRDWFASKAENAFPVIGAFDDESGRLMGFATYGSFRGYAANRFTLEHSVYIDSDCRGRGVASRLLMELIKHAGQQGYHLMVGVIDAENLSSIALHEKFGFSHAGTLSQAGFKFGRWLDLAFYQKILTHP
ncbi:GNAT family N-acetyltransferase [Marinobacterium mangrovicola]|uniref:Phosphinothricin acetyltransferase n=1 Tax=Marinobacterium mangrovicola TaxID=1476959 RepID=A0A4R1GNT1_9GAMM|nr:GNAT family N-acetyltransferase [Marinobacterium mangrovicola]TCK08943.1 phosphinothricin acetyltransferase [Marinobacterium mangrovicola]